MNSLLFFLRVREREPQKFELSERDKEAAPLKTVIPATTVNEREDVQFDTVKKSSEEGCNVGSEVFEGSLGPMEKHESIPISVKFEAGIRGSWEDGIDHCPAFSTSGTGRKYPHLTSVYGGRASRAYCVIGRSPVRRPPGDSANRR